MAFCQDARAGVRSQQPPKARAPSLAQLHRAKGEKPLLSTGRLHEEGFQLRSRKLFASTLTELKAMAAAASQGLSRM